MIYTPIHPSGITDGKPKLVNQTTQGTAVTFHTAQAGSSGYDEVFLYAANLSANPVSISVFADDGSITDPDDYYVKALVLMPNSPRISILDGQRLNNGEIVKAFASVNNAITISGNVNRIT